MAPSALPSLSAHALTQAGGGDRNQDAFLCRLVPPGEGAVRAVVAVSDGLGGACGGADASRLVLEVVGRETGSLRALPPDPPSFLQGLFSLAHREVVGARGTAGDSSGATLLMGIMDGGRLWLAQAGDGGIFRCRGGEAERLIPEHTVAQDALNRGIVTREELLANEAMRQLSGVLTRNLGSRTDHMPDVRGIEALPGEIFLFCTDGVCGHQPDGLVAPGEMADCLRSAPDLREAAERLARLAVERGSADDRTIVLIRVGAPSGGGPAPSPADAGGGGP